MREIKLTVRGDTVHASRHRAGIQGEANATALVVSFDESWDGYAKKITFWDALEQNPVERTLTVDLLVDAARDTRTYKTTIPGEPLARAGECLLIIDGWVDGVRARSMSVRLTVEEAPVADNAGEPTDPTPTQAELLQVQIETLIGDIQRALLVEKAAAAARDDAKNSAEEAEKHKVVAKSAAADAKESEKKAQAARQAVENMTVTTERVAYADTPSVEKRIEEDGSVNLHYKLPAGGGVPGGGTAGEVLRKTGGGDYDCHWVGPGALELDEAESSTVGLLSKELVNGGRGAVLLANPEMPDGYDRIRLRKVKVLVTEEETVRFAVGTYAEGKMTVETLLGDAQATEGAAELVLSDGYTADHTVCVAAFAQSAVIGVFDTGGALLVVAPQFSGDGYYPADPGTEIPVVGEGAIMPVSEIEFEYLRRRTVDDLRAKAAGQIAAVEARIGALEAAQETAHLYDGETLYEKDIYTGEVEEV